MTTTMPAEILSAKDSKRARAGDVVKGEHGKVSTFQNWGCRCPACRDASQADLARRYRAGTAPNPGPPREPPSPRAPARHGTDSQYHLGCRDAECTAAHAAAGRAYRARRRGVDGA